MERSPLPVLARGYGAAALIAAVALWHGAGPLAAGLILWLGGAALTLCLAAARRGDAETAVARAEDVDADARRWEQDRADDSRTAAAENAARAVPR